VRQTLFTIPFEYNGVPIFGFGVLFALWLLGTAGLIAWHIRSQGTLRQLFDQLWAWLLVAVAIVALPRVFAEQGGLPIRGYGVMLLAGVVSGVALAADRARRMGLHPDCIYSLAFWMFAAGIAGARLFHVIEYWDVAYRRETWGATLATILKVHEGGLVVYGSLIGGSAAFVIYAVRKRLPALALADLIAPSLVLGLALGRIGCLMNGCCFGGTCDYAWGLEFPQGSPPYFAQVQRGFRHGFQISGDPRDEPDILSVDDHSTAAAAGVAAGQRVKAINGQPVRSAADAHALLYQAYLDELPVRLTTEAGTVPVPAAPLSDRSLPVHPTQIYSAITAFLVFLFLLAYYPFRSRDGEGIALLLTLYPVLRFILEDIRTDEAAMFGTGLSISQNVSILLVAGIVGLWLYIRRQPRGSALPPRAATAAQPARAA